VIGEILVRRYIKNTRRNLAVSEIIGTIIMMGISTSTMSVMYYEVVNAPTPNPPPIIEISGTIENNEVIVTHRGGVPLDVDSELVLNVGGITRSFKVKDGLDSISKQDGLWCLGEKFVYPIEYDFDYSEYPTLNINVIDKETDSLVMTGTPRVNPLCDIGVIIFVDELTPRENDIVTFTIRATNYGNINASGILIEFLLPEGLIYNSSTSDLGSYDSNVGIWDIDQLLVSETAELIVTATVGNFVDADPTQLVVILDGSESIEPANWTLMLTGLSRAVQDKSRFPQNGAVELTVIQFGGFKPAYAQLEISPIAITESNVDSVVKDIQNIIQIGKKTPTAASILMAADVLKASDMFDPSVRQVILLVTDGNPTHCAIPDGDYLDDQCADVNGPKDGAVDARDYLVNLLDLNESDDSFNALSIEIEGDGHTYYLRDDLVWPQPGIELSSLTEDTLNRGWVRNVQTWQDFALAINSSFELIFNRLSVNISIKSTDFTDPKEANDETQAVLKPIPEFTLVEPSPSII
jgi:uncharacterized repeat protein (TIGR01451 family)